MSQFLDNLSGHFGLNQAEIDSVINSLTNKECEAEADVTSISNFSATTDSEDEVCEDNICDSNVSNRDNLNENNDKLDYIELFLAVSLGAKLRDSTQDPRYKKLKLLLNNNSRKAVNLANLWMDGQLSFDKMLATI